MNHSKAHIAFYYCINTRYIIIQQKWGWGMLVYTTNTQYVERNTDQITLIFQLNHHNFLFSTVSISIGV